MYHCPIHNTVLIRKWVNYGWAYYVCPEAGCSHVQPHEIGK